MGLATKEWCEVCHVSKASRLIGGFNLCRHHAERALDAIAEALGIIKAVRHG